MPAALTVHLDDDTKRALGRLAEKTDRSHDWLVNQAVQDYLALQAWQIDKINAGIAAADRGDLVTQAEIDRIVRKYDRRA